MFLDIYHFLRFNLVGQVSVKSDGQGYQVVDMPEEDWIIVEPGDQLGLYEDDGWRAVVPYDYCNKGKQYTLTNCKHPTSM